MVLRKSGRVDSRRFSKRELKGRKEFIRKSGLLFSFIMVSLFIRIEWYIEHEFMSSIDNTLPALFWEGEGVV